MVKAYLNTSSLLSQVKALSDNAEQYVQRIVASRKDQLANEFIQRVTPLIPKKTGALRDSVDASVDGTRITVSWYANNPYDGTEYGEIQYETFYENYTTPGTGPFWDIMFEQDGRRYGAFLRACEKILRKK